MIKTNKELPDFPFTEKKHRIYYLECIDGKYFVTKNKINNNYFLIKTKNMGNIQYYVKILDKTRRAGLPQRDYCVERSNALHHQCSMRTE